MALLNLSLELRNKIYRELLCPPKGIHLHYDMERCWRQEEEANLKGDSTEDADSEDEEYDENKFDKASSVTPHPIAILYTNHQVSHEASQVLYGLNRFTFDTSAAVAVRFLKNLPQKSLRCIKDLGFGRRSTSADDGDCTEHWQPLCDFISQHMHLTSLTIQIPRDTNYEVDESKEVIRPPNGEWFWWPAVRELTGMLMNGKIERLRLGFSATLLERDDASEDYAAVDILRTPNSKEEQDREDREHEEREATLRSGRPHKFKSVLELLEDQGKRRQRLDFVVTREDNSAGDVGTVLVLTRPVKI